METVVIPRRETRIWRNFSWEEQTPGFNIGTIQLVPPSVQRRSADVVRWFPQGDEDVPSVIALAARYRCSYGKNAMIEAIIRSKTSQTPGFIIAPLSLVQYRILMVFQTGEIRGVDDQMTLEEAQGSGRWSLLMPR